MSSTKENMGSNLPDELIAAAIALDQALFKKASALKGLIQAMPQGGRSGPHPCAPGWMN